MANRPALKVTFEPNTMRQMLIKIGVTQKELAKEIDRDVRTLRRYLANGAMPIGIYDKVSKLLWLGEQEKEKKKEADNTDRINKTIYELSNLGFTNEQILGEVSKSLAGVHPNMIDDEFEIIREVRFK